MNIGGDDGREAVSKKMRFSRQTPGAHIGHRQKYQLAVLFAALRQLEASFGWLLATGCLMFGIGLA
jgi:hypothetical protein